MSGSTREKETEQQSQQMPEYSELWRCIFQASLSLLTQVHYPKYNGRRKKSSTCFTFKREDLNFFHGDIFQIGYLYWLAFFLLMDVFFSILPSLSVKAFLFLRINNPFSKMHKFPDSRDCSRLFFIWDGGGWKILNIQWNCGEGAAFLEVVLHKVSQVIPSFSSDFNWK